MEANKDNRPEVNQSLLHEFIQVAKEFSVIKVPESELDFYHQEEDGSVDHEQGYANYEHIDGSKSVYFSYSLSTLLTDDDLEGVKFDAYSIKIHHLDEEERFESGYVLVPNQELEVIDHGNTLDFNYVGDPVIYDTEGNKVPKFSVWHELERQFDDQIARAVDCGDEEEVDRIKSDKQRSWTLYMTDYVAERSAADYQGKFASAFADVKTLLPFLVQTT